MTEQIISMSLLDHPDLPFPGPLVSLEEIHYRHTSKWDFILRGLCLNVHLSDCVGVVGLNVPASQHRSKLLLRS